MRFSDKNIEVAGSVLHRNSAGSHNNPRTSLISMDKGSRVAWASLCNTGTRNNIPDRKDCNWSIITHGTPDPPQRKLQSKSIKGEKPGDKDT